MWDSLKPTSHQLLHFQVPLGTTYR